MGETKKAETKSDYVSIEKDGKTITVHKDTIKSWEKDGWKGK